MVEDGLRHVLKRVKSCTNFSIELHALRVKVFPFSQMSSTGLILSFLVMGDQSLVNQPVVQSLLRGSNARKFWPSRTVDRFGKLFKRRHDK
jgi:hypothetical protein